MYSLVANEWVKIFRQIGTYIMLSLVVLLVLANGGLTKYFIVPNESSTVDWKQQLIHENEGLKMDLSSDGFMPASVRDMLEQMLAINEYRIEHDIPPSDNYNVWDFVKDSAMFINFAGLFVIIIAAGIVANEFSWGTIKILLVKPYHRWKFLMAKYFTVILFMVLILALLFICVFGLGALLFGFGTSGSSQVHLTYVDGIVVEKNMLLHLINTYLLNSLGVFFLATMAFMISAAFRVSGLAIGISIFLLLMGGTVTSLLATRFTWAKYILFANTDLTQYTDGSPLVEGMTMPFSIMMLTIYFVMFHLLAFVFFTKRDVST